MEQLPRDKTLLSDSVEENKKQTGKKKNFQQKMENVKESKLD